MCCWERGSSRAPAAGGVYGAVVVTKGDSPMSGKSKGVWRLSILLGIMVALPSFLWMLREGERASQECYSRCPGCGRNVRRAPLVRGGTVISGRRAVRCAECGEVVPADAKVFLGYDPPLSFVVVVSAVGAGCAFGGVLAIVHGIAWVVRGFKEDRGPRRGGSQAKS